MIWSCENPWLQCGVRNTTCCHTMSSLSGSNHSLWSKGPVDASVFTSQSTQKKAQEKWMTNEESELLAFLKGLSATAGDGANFTKKHFQDAAQHLKIKCPVQTGGEKVWSTCQTKWLSVSSLINYTCVISANRSIITAQERLLSSDGNQGGFCAWLERCHRDSVCKKWYHLDRFCQDKDNFITGNNLINTM